MSISIDPRIRKNILLAIPHEKDRERIRALLGGHDYDCEYEFFESLTAADATRVADQRAYSCIFLDMALPDASGLNVLEQIYNADTDLTTSPVVMVTDDGCESMILDAFRLGAQGYVLKQNMNTVTVNIALGKARDMHDLKKSRHNTRTELAHIRKMEAIGQLTSGVAHDFNNLLTVVTGNIHLLRRRFDNGFENYDPEDISAKIQSIEDVARKGADLVRRLMVFTRQSPLAQEVVNVNERITETVELLKRILTETVDIQAILSEDAWPVFLDPGEFENTLINLAVNARDAMPKGGTLTIETQNVVLDHDYTLHHPGMRPGQYMMMAVSDTGIGMSAEVAKQIFEPFFSTKPAGEGTGLGLSMAYGFIRQSGGYVHVYSQPGKGTVFRIYLPRHIGAEDGVSLSEISGAPQGRETILVVEDDDMLRARMVEMLEILGYSVMQAVSADAGMEVLDHEGPRVALVLADIALPGINSCVEFAHWATRKYPAIKFLFLSGYMENALPVDVLPWGGAVISKPFRRESLAARVREILNEGKRRVA